MHDRQLFAFEDDFVASLRCIPMAVRLKLDRCGVKLSLRQWSRFTRGDRQALLERPCVTEEDIQTYRKGLVDLVALRAGEAARLLDEAPAVLAQMGGHPPAAVEAHARAMGLSPPTAHEWRELTELQRFALIKLTRDNHDNVNFEPAMREFGLSRPLAQPHCDGV